MLVIGIDTTAVMATVAIAEIEGGNVKTYSLFSSKNRLTHSEKLMPMLDQALKIQSKSISDVGLIAVNVGPGSFTGVRIGVATVKGLAAAGDIPCAAVSTLDSLAENLSGIRGIICPVMDARRDQFYNALYKNGKRLCADRAISASELQAELDGMKGRVYVCGDGADVFISKYEGSKKLTRASASSVDQNALSVAVCGYRLYEKGLAVKASELKPIYLRMSQAERERNAK